MSGTAPAIHAWAAGWALRRRAETPPSSHSVTLFTLSP